MDFRHWEEGKSFKHGSGPELRQCNWLADDPLDQSRAKARPIVFLQLSCG